jgi:hypothetical protein
MTWFRREAGVIWLEGFGNDPKIQTELWKMIEI